MRLVRTAHLTGAIRIRDTFFPYSFPVWQLCVQSLIREKRAYPGNVCTSLDGGISQPFPYDLLSPHYGTFRTAVQNWGKEGAGTWMRDSFSNQTDLDPMEKIGDPLRPFLRNLRKTVFFCDFCTFFGGMRNFHPFFAEFLQKSKSGDNALVRAFEGGEKCKIYYIIK